MDETAARRLADEAFALAQRLFARWAATEWPGFEGRCYRVFRRAANRAIRRQEKVGA